MSELTPLWDDSKLDEYLGGKSSGAIRQMRSRDPESLPPSIVVGNRHFYDPTDVAEWVAAKKEGVAQTTPSMGRFADQQKATRGTE